MGGWVVKNNRKSKLKKDKEPKVKEPTINAPTQTVTRHSQPTVLSAPEAQKAGRACVQEGQALQTPRFSIDMLTMCWLRRPILSFY